MPSSEKQEDLERVLSEVAGEPVVILITGHPDPDAIGAALAHQRICDRLGVPATIAHVMPVSHRENRALVKLLNVKMKQISCGSDLDEFKYLSLVDTSTPEPSIELPEHIEALSVVDHHRAAGRTNARFVDVRLSYGASCTIYAQYLQAGLVPLEAGSEEDTRIATGLLFGIQTDTDDFTLATPPDFTSAAYAKTYCDVGVLRQVGRHRVSATAMSVLGRALSNLQVVREFALAGVGHVPAQDRDAIGGAADYILSREDIETVLVYGIVNGRIDGSLRTTSASLDPANMLEETFGHGQNGKPYGGGRADKGGFQVPLGLLAETADRETLWKMVQGIVHARLKHVVPEL